MTVNKVTLDDAATLCRAFGHAWSPITTAYNAPVAKRVKAGKQAWNIDVQCDRCTTKRHDLVSSSGELATRRYVYPEGYKRTRIPRPELRMELRTVLKVWGSEEEMEMW